MQQGFFFFASNLRSPWCSYIGSLLMGEDQGEKGGVWGLGASDVMNTSATRVMTAVLTAWKTNS